MWLTQLRGKTLCYFNLLHRKYKPVFINQAGKCTYLISFVIPGQATSTITSRSLQCVLREFIL